MGKKTAFWNMNVNPITMWEVPAEESQGDDGESVEELKNIVMKDIIEF